MLQSFVDFLLVEQGVPTKHDAAETMVKAACQMVVKWRRLDLGGEKSSVRSRRRQRVGLAKKTPKAAK
jgi:hypothetical protein